MNKDFKQLRLFVVNIPTKFNVETHYCLKINQISFEIVMNFIT